MRYFRWVFGCVLVFLLVSTTVHAGFGITPPYVRNSSLTRNSVYEQTILLVRNDPDVALKAQITLDVPGINDWFTVLEGNEFLLPEGESKVPMTVRVEVPEKADFKQYLGNIRIKTLAADNTARSGAVSISLGAQVDVDITVIDREIKDFRVRRIGIEDLNEGRKVGWLYFPGKIKFKMFIENTGNVAVAPSEVLFRIYDPSGQVLLESTRHTNRITKIKPFDTQEVEAELPTRLPSGAYIVRYEIKNDEEIKHEGELNLNIFPYGTLQTAGYGFLGLSLAHKISIVLPIATILGLALTIYLTQQKGRRRRRRERT